MGELMTKDVIDNICIGSKTLNREKILELESITKTMPQLQVPVKHYIHGGMYIREITIPKNTVITGAIYKFDHFDIMISGDVTVSTDTGESKRLTGYQVLNGMLGKKRAGYVHEETTWITVHPFDGEDGDSVQKFITAETFEELESFYKTINTLDYQYLLEDLELTNEDVQLDMENHNVIDLESSHPHMYLSDSKIQGTGLFSSLAFKSGDIICPLILSETKTTAGRYSNHALYPNGGVHGTMLIALRDIEKDEEITMNYRSNLCRDL